MTRIITNLTTAAAAWIPPTADSSTAESPTETATTQWSTSADGHTTTAVTGLVTNNIYRVTSST